MFTNDGNGTGMYMPVAPMGNYYGNNGGGWGGDGACQDVINYIRRKGMNA